MLKNYIKRENWNYKYIGNYLSNNYDKRIIYNTWKAIKEVKNTSNDYMNIEQLLRYYLIGTGEIYKDGEYIQWITNKNGLLIPKFAKYKMNNFVDFTNTIEVI